MSSAQRREIVRTTLRMVVRRPRGSTAARGARGGLVSSLIVQVVAGLLIAFGFSRGADPFTVALYSTSSFMLLVAVFVVMEFATIVTGPDDLSFYTPLPVPPRAYVAAKIEVTCFFGLAFAGAYALPALVLLPLMGAPLAFLGQYLYMILDGALISCLLLVVIMGLAVRFVSYQRIRNVAAWVQFFVFFGVYGGFAVFQRLLSASTQGPRLRVSPLLLLAPSAWGPSLLRVGEGAVPAVGVALSVAAPLLLWLAAVRVVAAAYDGKLAEASVAQGHARSRPKKTGGGGVLWRSPEERGMALLIGNLFRHDNQFRMGVLTIIPVTVLYVALIVVVNRAPIIDPFTQAGRAGFSATILLYLALGFYPIYVKNALSYSSQAEASWLFHSSPADPLLILRAARRFILVYFIAPYLLLFAVAYAVSTHAYLHTAQHFVAIALLVLIETDLLLLFAPQIPFSRKPAAGRRGAGMFLRIFAGLVLLAPIYVLVYFVYPHPAAYWAALAVLVACLVAVRLTGRRYAARRLSREEFAA